MSSNFTLGVFRFNLIERVKGNTKPRQRVRGRYHIAQDAAVLEQITALVAERPTYGYRRITALLNRDRRAAGLAPINHKRVYRIMQASRLLLARRYTIRPEYIRDGKVGVMRSNLRWCCDGFKVICWKGEIVRGTFIIDAHDREILAWRAVVNIEISGSDVRDMMLEAVERRFGEPRAAAPLEILSDNGSAYAARETRISAQQLGLKPCFTPVGSPQGQ